MSPGYVLSSWEISRITSVTGRLGLARVTVQISMNPATTSISILIQIWISRGNLSLSRSSLRLKVLLAVPNHLSQWFYQQGAQGQQWDQLNKELPNLKVSFHNTRASSQDLSRKQNCMKEMSLAWHRLSKTLRRNLQERRNVIEQPYKTIQLTSLRVITRTPLSAPKYSITQQTTKTKLLP